MADRRGRQQPATTGMSEAEKRALTQQIYEAVVRAVADRTPDSLQEVQRVEAELQSQVGTLEQRIFRLETGSGGGFDVQTLRDALQNNRRAAQGLLSWAQRTQGGTRGPLSDMVERLMG